MLDWGQRSKGKKTSLSKHTRNSTGVISWNPSLSSGATNRFTKPAKAIPGSRSRFSGFIYWYSLVRSCQKSKLLVGQAGKLACSLSALTASLCSHSFCGALKSTQRMGMLCFCARATQAPRTSASAFVLSCALMSVVGLRCKGFRDSIHELPIATDLPSFRCWSATFRQRSLCSMHQLNCELTRLIPVSYTHLTLPTKRIV